MNAQKRRRPRAGGRSAQYWTASPDDNAKRFAVVIRKASTGRDIVFSLFATQGEADGAGSRLRGFGLEARVMLLETPGLAPGSTVARDG